MTEEKTQTLRGEGNEKTEAESDREVNDKGCQGKLTATRNWKMKKKKFSSRAFVGTTNLSIPCFWTFGIQNYKRIDFCTLDAPKLG